MENYLKNHLGELNRLVGRMQGRKEINLGDTLTAIVPTKYQKEILQNQKIPLRKRYNLEFKVDSKISGLEVEHK